MTGPGDDLGPAEKATDEAAGWAEPANMIVKTLALSDRCEKMGANAAFPLEGIEKVWLLLSGHIDVFYLTDGPSAESKEHQGVRHHLMRIDAGGMAFGLLAPDRPSHVLAVPSNGAEIVETTRHRIRAQVVSGGDTTSAFVAGFSVWVASLSEAMASGPLVRDAHKLDPATVAQVSADIVILSKSDPLWILAKPGVFALPDGSPVEGADGSPFRVPITRSFSLRARQDTEVTPLSMQEWVVSDQAPDDIDRLHEFLLSNAATRISRRVEEQAQETERKKAFDRGIFGAALGRLAGILLPKSIEVDTISGDPLIAAAALVCNQADIKLALSSARIRRILDSKDPVAGLTAESGLRIRRIHLAGDWWRQDHGPLLAFLGDAKTPRALLPNGPRSYRMVNALTGEDVAVTGKIAKTLEDTAYAFYTPFPAGQIDLWKLIRFSFRGGSGDGWTIVGMILLGGILSLGLPIVTAWVIDPVIPEAEINLLTVLILALIVLGVSMTGFSFVQAIAMLRIEGRMDNAAQAAVWDRLLNLPASFFRGYTVGDLTNRAMGVDAIRALVTGSVTTVLLHSVYGLFSLGLMFWYDWKLSVGIVLISFVYAVIVFFIGRRVLSRNRDILRLGGRIQGIVLQILGAVSKLRVAGAERSAFALWSDQYSELLAITYHQRLLNNAVVVFKALFSYLIIAAVIAIIGLQGGQLFAIFRAPANWSEISADSLHLIMPAATFVAFNVALGQFMTAVFGLSETAIQLLTVKPLYERIQPIFEAEVEGYDGTEDPGELTGEIEIDGVCFRYKPDSPLVLEGVSLRTSPGEFVAVVGPSGAGKSTLVRLLLGFDSPESGSIFYDGMDLKQLEKRSLRHNFGVVLQHGRLLTGSIYNNITAGANLTRDEAMEAARLAGLDKDIESMPMGLDTFITEGANTLSGGQRQRLMIARAIARKPCMLIFDEATSALDNETQEIVTKGLETLNSTRFVIAHRLSTIVNADRIYVLDAGRIVEQGSYEDLMAQRGVFAKLAERQIA